MKNIEIYTDGACSGNPGPGGWGAVLIYKNTTSEISGSNADTTNNRMELMAVIESLRTLKESCKVTLYTDSSYVQNGISKWIHNWKNNNWKTANKDDVKNKDLWIILDELSLLHSIEWKWVKGHAGNKWNEIADKLATNAIKK